MNWEGFYLVAFLVGFLLSAVSFLAGAIHLPHFGHGHAVQMRHGMRMKAGRAGLSPFNFGTISAFLAWFGGTGYLLERFSNIWVYLGLFIAAMSGLGGAAIIFFLLSKLMAQEDPLDPADYEMVGVLGRVASPIKKGGTGELIYSRAGSRRASPARSEDGVEITRDTEVIVTRFEKGIAYVRRWDEMSGDPLNLASRDVAARDKRERS
jgi:membrane protein implicated in regulation of membrane protease activity